MMKRIVLLLIAALLFCGTASAQKTFDMRYKEAVSYFDSQQYELAIKMLEIAKKVPGATKEEVSKANSLIRQCRAAIKKSTVTTSPHLSIRELDFPSKGARLKVNVSNAGNWNVLSHPLWVKVARSRSLLFITADQNDSIGVRHGRVEISASNGSILDLLVSQEGTPAPERKLGLISQPPPLPSLSMATGEAIPLKVNALTAYQPTPVVVETIPVETAHKATLFSDGFVLAGGDWYLPFAAPSVFYTTGIQNGGIEKDYEYSQTASVFFGKFKLLPGLSMNALQASFYSINGQMSLQSLSAFTNLEFMVGGCVPKVFDAGLVASGVWYVPWDKLMPTLPGCVSGIDLFLGGIISSSLPIANINVKTGFKTFLDGNLHGNEVDFTDPSIYPGNIMFVVSVGVDFGINPASGRPSILRLF